MGRADHLVHLGGISGVYLAEELRAGWVVQLQQVSAGVGQLPAVDEGAVMAGQK
ncbi:hypothetical protein D3C85_1757680 [compost metagenome]